MENSKVVRLLFLHAVMK
jgi:hypothetical protein